MDAKDAGKADIYPGNEMPRSAGDDAPVANQVGDEEQIVIPRTEESLSVIKQWVQAGEVTIRKQVTTQDQSVTVELLHDELDIQRVQVNRLLQEGETAEPRQEGDTFVIPVVEEELVVTKRYVVREELRISRRKVAEQQQLSETVKSEQVYIEHSEGLSTDKQD